MKEDIYRIKEQYGKFYIQKKFIEKEIISNDFHIFLNSLFNYPLLKYKETEVYYTIDSYGYKSSMYCKPAVFKTYEKSIEYIEKLNPVYHNINKQP